MQIAYSVVEGAIREFFRVIEVLIPYHFRKILYFFKRHDDIARKIAENGFNLIKEHLKLSKVTWYWKVLLKKYTRLLKFKPSLNSSLMKVGT